jgi:hypothetical protein
MWIIYEEDELGRLANKHALSSLKNWGLGYSSVTNPTATNTESSAVRVSE